MDGRLPIHPQPREGESITSWINRIAISNGITIRQLLSWYLNEADWRYRDLDFLKRGDLNILANVAHVQGGIDKLWRMALTPWRDVISEPYNVMDRKGWVSSREVIRYCPACLQTEGSYPRLVWRLLFLPVCSRHGVVLQRSSARGTTDLTARPLVRPINCPRLSRLGSWGIQILESQALFESFGWPESAQDCFLVLLALVRYLNLYLQREPSWIESLKSHGFPTKPPFDWRENEAVAALLIERALGLVENWPKNIETFVRANKARFKRLQAEYGIHLPKKLVHLIRNGIEQERINVESKIENSRNVKDRSPQDRVGQAVQDLLETNAPISLRAVSRIAEVSFGRVKSDARVNAIVLEGQSRFRLRKEAEIQNAIRMLRERGLNPSVGAIATYLGRSHRYLKCNRT